MEFRPLNGGSWIVFSPTRAASEELFVSPSAGAPATMTTSLAPTLSVRFRLASWPTANWMSRRTAGVNPGRLARASYIPGGSPGMLYEPSSAVTTDRVSPVSIFFSVTSTPGSTPPVSSITTPDTFAAVICADAPGTAIAIETSTIAAVGHERRAIGTGTVVAGIFTLGPRFYAGAAPASTVTTPLVAASL